MPKTCKLCDYPIFSKGLCLRHDREANREKYQIKKKVSTTGLKHGKIKRSSIKAKPRKPTGERSLFLSIWEERPHYCVNCKVYLGEEPIAHYFSHIKPKGLYPELRLDKNNIALNCIQCHTDWGCNPDNYRKRTK